MPSPLGRGLWGLGPRIKHKNTDTQYRTASVLLILVLVIQCIASPDPDGHINYSGLGLAVSRDRVHSC